MTASYEDARVYFSLVHILMRPKFLTRLPRRLLSPLQENSLILFSTVSLFEQVDIGLLVTFICKHFQFRLSSIMEISCMYCNNWPCNSLACEKFPHFEWRARVIHERTRERARAPLVSLCLPSACDFLRYPPNEDKNRLLQIPSSDPYCISGWIFV